MNILAVVGIVMGGLALAGIVYMVYAYYVAWKAGNDRRVQEYLDAEDAEDETDSEDDEFQDLRRYNPPGSYAYSGRHADPVAANHPPSVPVRAPSPATATNLDVKSPPTESTVMMYEAPKTPEIEEYNDVRWFYSKSLPITLSGLGVTNCVECELLDAVVPRGDYIVHSRNQTFQIRQPFEASVTEFTDITIPVGDYSASALATTITNLVATAGLTSFTAGVSTVTSNFTFSDDSVVDVSFNVELAYDLGWGTTLNLNLGSAQYPVDATASYVVSAANNTFEVAVNSGSYVTYTIAVGTYTGATLAAAINTAMASPAALTAAYIADAGPTIAIYYTGFAIDVRLSTGLAALIGQDTLVSSVLFDATASLHYANSQRADLYGSRYVEIRTQELDGPSMHRRGVLQSLFLSSEITNWRNTSDERRRRRFPMPLSIQQLTISFKERHPSLNLESQFRDMELNGLAVAFSLCFRRLRYKNENQITQLHMH